MSEEQPILRAANGQSQEAKGAYNARSVGGLSTLDRQIEAAFEVCAAVLSSEVRDENIPMLSGLVGRCVRGASI